MTNDKTPSPLDSLGGSVRYEYDQIAGKMRYYGSSAPNGWIGDEAPPAEHAAVGQKPFMYGIMEPDGTAFMDEVCVDLDPGPLEEMIEEGEMTGYTVVPLYLHPPASGLVEPE